MSLLYCRPEHVKVPFYVEGLGVSLHTSQELAYVIYNHPLLAMDDFVDERLIDFVRYELDMEFVAGKMENWSRSREDRDELLIMLLKECGYYRASEVGQFRQKITAYRKLHPAEYGRKKAEMYFGLGQYGNAVLRYRELLEYPSDATVTERFLGNVYYNLGACYARMFQAAQALDSFCQSYRRLQDRDALRCIHHLVGLNPHLEPDGELKAKIDAEDTALWDREVQDALLKARSSNEVGELDDLFARDPVKRAEGVAGLLRQWKQEYRKMA